MRQQGRRRHRGQNRAGCATEHLFAQTRVPVAAHHHEVDRVVRDVVENRVANVDVTLRHFGEGDREIVACQMLGDVGSLDFAAVGFVLDQHNID